MLDGLIKDIRYGLRNLARTPGFTAVSVLTLALGIGANTAIFSVVQGVVLAPLPFRQPEGLALVMQRNPVNKLNMDSSYPDFLDWQHNARSFQQMAALTWQEYNITNPGTPEHLNGKQISAGFFDTLGVKLFLGREFSLEEDRRGGAPAVIISHRLWEVRFNRSADAIGKTVVLAGAEYTTVGVLPSAFQFMEDADVYTPLGQGDPLVMNDRTLHPIACVARLKPGVSLAQAQSDMQAVQENLNRLYPRANQGLGTAVLALKEELVGDVSKTLLVLLGAVGLVLLIACANVANLLLARSATRTQEFAIRTALGAQCERLVRQLITESIVLSLAGGSLGLAVAKWGLKAVLAAMPGDMPRSENIGLNVPVLLFALGVSIAVGITFGLAPALKSARIDPQVSLKKGGRRSTSGHHRVQGGLVVVQTALTLVLLAGAGLLVRTIRQLWEVNPGFDARHVVTFKVGLSPSGTNEPASMRAAYQQLIQRVRGIPGVQSLELTVLVPLSQDVNIGAFWASCRPPASVAEAPRALFYWTGPQYLGTMGITLLQGRYFGPGDTSKSEPVVVIDSTLAHTYFPGKDPIGQSLTIPHWGVARIIGVVAHVKHWGLDDQNWYTENQIYASLDQLPDAWVATLHQRISVIVRTPLGFATAVPAFKAVVYGAGSDQPVYSVRTMEEMVSQSMSSRRFPLILLGTFAGLALLLASIGIYGVISYSVAHRVPEIGIRIALGAEKSHIFRMVIGQGLGLSMAGVVIGQAAALALMRARASPISVRCGSE